MHPVEVETVVECFFGLDGGAMFGVVPRPLWERTNPPDTRNRITLATRCLVLRAGDRVVLVDTGMGDKWNEKERSIYAVDHGQGALRESLTASGVDPETITDVLLTHLHFDHAGGVTRRDATGALVATFPKAVHWVQRENWVWAHEPTPRDAGSYRAENFALLGTPDGPELRLLDGVTTLFDAVEVIPTRGHTPGMQVLRFESGGRTYAYMADILPTEGHLQLPYVMGYDCFPLTTMREKRELLEEAVRGDWVLVLEHDPESAGIVVERTGTDRYGVVARGALGTLASL